ncbi:protein argonaute 16-like [Canna indica]|uniref:Protein argonaute 16-like n=1 Tax=Canna indica TaxID=4628 RepID=A0AAQ3Q1M5_9LILI|nr:protein argonaute 16-like [Canna indica]
MTSHSGKVGEDGSSIEQRPESILTTKPEMSNVPERYLMARPAYGTVGHHIQLVANHFNVKCTLPNAVFYNYTVIIKSDEMSDTNASQTKGFGRKVLDKLYQTYYSELDGKEFVYDGEKSIFTIGPLPQNNYEFTVVLEESSTRATGEHQGDDIPNEGNLKRFRRSNFTRTFRVEISYSTKIPLNSIALALKGNATKHTQDALRVLDIILRQQQAKRGCLLVKQSFFSGDHTNFLNLGGGATGCQGFHSSFRTISSGLSLNIDVTTTMIMTPGPVLDFLLANQNIRDFRQIDWAKAKRMLKNMKIKTQHTNMEFKIIGISEFPCNKQLFPMRARNNYGEAEVVEITVLDYFLKNHNINLEWSAGVPCLNVGKPKRPSYIPVELCHLVSLQRYTKALSAQQRASLVEKSRQKPKERITVITEAVKKNRYDEDPFLSSCGLYIDKQLTKFDGRVLNAPTLKVGNEENCVPRNGRWNFNQKRLWRPIQIKDWAIVNFSARCDLGYLSRELNNCGRNKGIVFDRPMNFVEEDRQWVRSSPLIRVEKMFEKMMATLPRQPQFLLCVLPERKNSDIYGPWKKKNLVDMGIITQCISPTKINDQYLTNVLLKINAKLGGINSVLALECTRSIPLYNHKPTMIFGMDVCHGSPNSAFPSIAAVVGSRYWPSISRYSASVRTQSPKLEMIDSLYVPMENGEDDGIIRDLLLDFCHTSNGLKPSQIIIFRDGVSETQFNQVLNVELNQIIKVIEKLGVDELPKFTVIVAQKNHHTKLFLDGARENVNVPPGTVVDTAVVHPRNYDFYMCAHAGLIGTSRPIHYNVLLDEIGFSPDDLQMFVHALSYVYQRSTTAVSMVAPVCYAHLAAAQMAQFIKVEEVSTEQEKNRAIPELGKLHQYVRRSMFFC